MKKNSITKKKYLLFKNSLKLISPLQFNKYNCFYYEIRKYSFFEKFVIDQNDFKPNNEDILFLDNFILNERKKINDNIDNKYMITISPKFIPAILNLKELPLLHNSIYKNIENIMTEKKNNSNSNISISKIKEIYREKFGKNLSRTKIHRIIRNKLHFSFKKTILKPKKLEHIIYKKMSFLYIKCMIRSLKFKLNFIFIDESCFKLKNNNFRDWIKRNNFGHYGNDDNNKKINFLLAIGVNNIIHYKLTNENTNTNTFKNFFIEILNKLNSDDLTNTIIIMDNLTSHLTVEIKKIIISKSLKVLYTVPYESIFNPIELSFRGIKLFTYKKIYNTLSDLENDIKTIINSTKFKTTLYKNFLETLEKYSIFIQNNKYFDMNQK